MDYMAYAEFDVESWPSQDEIDALVDYLFERDPSAVCSFSEPSEPQFLGVRGTVTVDTMPGRPSLVEAFAPGSRQAFSVVFVRHIARCVAAFLTTGIKVKPEGFRCIEISRGDSINAETQELVRFFEESGQLDPSADGDPV